MIAGCGVLLELRAVVERERECSVYSRSLRLEQSLSGAAECLELPLRPAQMRRARLYLHVRLRWPLLAVVMMHQLLHDKALCPSTLSTAYRQSTVYTRGGQSKPLSGRTTMYNTNDKCRSARTRRYVKIAPRARDRPRGHAHAWQAPHATVKAPMTERGTQTTECPD